MEQSPHSIDESELRAWREASTHPEVEAFFLEARREIAEAVRSHRPLCLATGACCRFEAFGHRMYLSGLEAAFVVDRIDRRRIARGAAALDAGMVASAKARGDCPYLAEGRWGALCGEHEERPLGCRIFHCDRGPAGSDDWQSALYERLHTATQALHDRLGVPYRYLEWREALAALAR